MTLSYAPYTMRKIILSIITMPVEEARSHLKDVAFTVPYSQLIKEQMQKGSLYAPAKDKRFDSRMKEIAGKVVEYEAQ